MFDKMKAFLDMQRKIEDIKKELDESVFDILSSDGEVKITMNGSQEVKEITIQRELKDADKCILEKNLKEVYNRAIKRSHELAAQKMKDVTGFNLPGLT